MSGFGQPYHRHGTFSHRLYILFLIFTIVFSGIGTASSSFSQQATEAEIKAALAFKFPVYVRWPDDTPQKNSDVFKCCILGHSPLADLLMHFDGETVMDKTIRVQRLTTIEAIETCHMLFVGDSEKKSLPKIWKAIKGKPILTLGDMKGFAQAGGIINFIRRENSVHFEINPNAGKKAGLEISSKLLRLAEITQ